MLTGWEAGVEYLRALTAAGYAQQVHYRLVAGRAPTADEGERLLEEGRAAGVQLGKAFSKS